MINYFIIMSIISFLIIIYIRFKIYIYDIDDKSERINQLKNLNKEYQFNNIKNTISIKKSYDNKYYYYKINPLDYLIYDLSKNKENYKKKILKLEEYHIKYLEYKKRYNDIISNNKSKKISEKIIRHFEKDYYGKYYFQNDIKLKVNIEINYYDNNKILMLVKKDTFYTTQIEEIIKKLDVSFLDKNIYDSISLVERAEVSDSLRYDILKKDGFKCVICGAKAEGNITLHIDHIYPISKGGKSTYNNLRTLCNRCNMGKSDKIE